MIRLECKDGTHFKFWDGDVKGASLTVHFGRIGTEGQVKAKKLASPSAAQAELEKLIREKLAKGYVKKGAATKTKDDAPLLELAELLAPKHAETKRRVTLALKDPAAYAKKYAEELEDRSAEDDPVDPWLALVTAVTNDDIELATGLDWKSAAEDIHAGVAKVVAKKKLAKPDVFAFYDEDAHLKTKTIDFIALCGRALSAHGLAVVELDISSDSYELTVIPWNQVARAKELAKKAGGGLILHGPSTPLAKPLAAPAQKAGPTAKIEKKKFGWRVEHDESFARLPGVLRITGEAKRKTFLIDCRVWPPKEKLIAPGQFNLTVHPADERKRICHSVFHKHENGKFDPRPQGILRIEQPGKPPVDLLERLPDHFDVDFAVWIDDLAVFFPSASTTHSKNGKRPLVWNGKTLAPAKGLPDVKGKPQFLRVGVARTGKGEDVLLWEGMGFRAKGDSFAKAWQLTPELQVYDKVVGAPAPISASASADGFFYVQQRGGKTGPKAILREATKGKCVERARLDFTTWGQPIAAFDGSIVFGVNRSGAPKKPVLGVFHPATSELTFVPPNVVAFRKDDIADAYGVSKGKGKDAFLWVLDDEEFRRVAWSAILALPRVKAIAK